MSTAAPTTDARNLAAPREAFGGKSGGRAARNVLATVVMWACFFIAVSYTHLDVYKRQALATPRAVRAAPLPATAPAAP